MLTRILSTQVHVTLHGQPNTPQVDLDRVALEKRVRQLEQICWEKTIDLESEFTSSGWNDADSLSEPLAFLLTIQRISVLVSFAAEIHRPIQL
jgi:hypothetical protein